MFHVKKTTSEKANISCQEKIVIELSSFEGRTCPHVIVNGITDNWLLVEKKTSLIKLSLSNSYWRTMIKNHFLRNSLKKKRSKPDLFPLIRSNKYTFLFYSVNYFSEQLRSIKENTRVSKIFCRNLGINTMQENMFLLPQRKR